MLDFTVEGGTALVLARGAADAALLSAFGALLSIAWLAPKILAGLADAGAVARQLKRVGWISLAAAGLLSLVWLALESVDLAGSVSGVPVVLQTTLFGHLILARLGLLGVAAILLARRRSALAAGAAAASVLTQAGLGHGFAMTDGPSWLLVSDALHILAASAWLGSLVPLAILIAALPPPAALLAARRFSRLGTLAVTILVATAIYQSYVLIGALPGWIGTAYGIVAIAKLDLLLLLLAFAALNKLRLSPALDSTQPARARSRLIRSIAAETGVGLAVVLAAGLLTSLPPSMHEQPSWPFPWRFSLDAINEDESFRQEVLLAAAALAAAVIAALAALWVRLRIRVVIIACAVLVAARALPHFDLLLAEADPTYYWHSPTGFSSASIAQGAALYPGNCASCHGAEGHGDGPAAKSLSVPPADLTAEHLWAHADGELFWWVSHGIEAPNGGMAMPGFAGTLTEGQRWGVIDWIRANNAGQARQLTGAWSRPIQAPDIQLECASGRSETLTELRGQVVRIVFGPATAQPGVMTVAFSPEASVVPTERSCVARDPAVLVAYATVTGLSATKLAGAELLVDSNGWLRAVQPQDANPSWNDPVALADAVKDIEARPLTAAPTSHAGMKM